MIEIKNLHKSYKTGNNSLHVLKGIDFSVKEGELVSIMGSSGSGKSTLLNILGMLDEADEGTYTLDNTPIKNLNEKIAAQYRNKFLGFIFQSFIFKKILLHLITYHSYLTGFIYILRAYVPSHNHSSILNKLLSWHYAF